MRLSICANASYKSQPASQNATSQENNIPSSHILQEPFFSEWFKQSSTCPMILRVFNAREVLVVKVQILLNTMTKEYKILIYCFLRYFVPLLI